MVLTNVLIFRRETQIFAMKRDDIYFKILTFCQKSVDVFKHLSRNVMYFKQISTLCHECKIVIRPYIISALLGGNIGQALNILCLSFMPTFWQPLDSELTLNHKNVLSLAQRFYYEQPKTIRFA